jgi:hypothetical protein
MLRPVVEYVSNRRSGAVTVSAPGAAPPDLLVVAAADVPSGIDA